ncbi:MAG: hypothetical protein JWQ11_1771 [Rhizobacter sp.]|nr:hypothetical protein [Rhizobacter sp.]
MLNVDATVLKEALCAAFCREVSVSDRGDKLAISLPMTGRDGDHMTIYAAPTAGGWRLSDMGATMMRLSYEHDLQKLLTGARERLLQSILREQGLEEDDGELFVEVPADGIARGLFVLGQGLSRVEDLGMWTKPRVESTFIEELRGIILQSVPSQDVVSNYAVHGIRSSQDYPVDFFIRTPHRPLYLFGVNNRDKARLTTIVLQHLLAHHPDSFESMVVCSDLSEVPRQDFARLLNAANDVVPGISDPQVIAQKIAHRRAA